ncbi:hypothetical protein VTK73DRAFT_10346 [Phialemonium thermophilum]|uniref:Uncharacterized protein n=1 Tax=Phialemonium thermophilum TaxID=223376 RepID=A0ABR3VXA9_9PEZI
MREKEEALVESALARIRRAQAKGRAEVKLNQEELEALERRRERLLAEEEQKRRKQREQRFSVPLSHLEPVARPASSRGPALDAAAPAAGSSEALAGARERTNYPPMGYFPPPSSASRTRPRSGTTSSQRPPSRDPAADRSRGSSPFRYSYVQRSDYRPSSRHASDPTALPRTRGPLPHEEPWSAGSYSRVPSASSVRSASRPSHPAVDPFLYMTGGPQASYATDPADSRRHGGRAYAFGSAPPDAAGPSRGSRRRMNEDRSSDETTSEDGSSEGARDDGPAYASRTTRSRPAGGGGGAPLHHHPDDISNNNNVIVVEGSPEPDPAAEPEPRRQREPEAEPSAHRSTRKSSAPASPAKRKTGGSSRKKKAR